ncbi:MAG: arginyltransferase [Endozoicomonas sp. (ex Botrylloides leachii)]|nr:arginyltransferase [Endozoicomonas sp. (ex Botrylloides leachii)]
MTALKNIKFYATHPHSCSYLPNQQATTLFMDTDKPLSLELYSQLADIGFRRSGSHIYRPHCISCKACIPARIPVAEFKFSRSQKRVWKRNQDLTISRHKPEMNHEIYALYEHYISVQHKDGDMYPPSVEQFNGFLIDSPSFCSFYHVRLDGQLIAVAVVDMLQNSLSAIYTFYHPDFNKRSLGRFCILWQIMKTQRLEMKYLHLGYWVKGCKKMDYKMDYRPIELLIDNHWSRLL